MTKQRVLLEQLRITSYVCKVITKQKRTYIPLFFIYTLWNVDQFVVFFSFFSFEYSLMIWGVEPKIFEAFIFVCILAGAMKLFI